MSTNIFKYIDINGIWNKIPKLLRMVIILLFIFIATYSLLNRYAHESNINTIKQIELTLGAINESLNNTAVFQDEQIKLNQQKKMKDFAKTLMHPNDMLFQIPG